MCLLVSDWKLHWIIPRKAATQLSSSQTISRVQIKEKSLRSRMFCRPFFVWKRVCFREVVSASGLCSRLSACMQSSVFRLVGVDAGFFPSWSFSTPRPVRAVFALVGAHAEFRVSACRRSCGIGPFFLSPPVEEKWVWDHIWFEVDWIQVNSVWK